jgi:hypothetical protein
MEVKNRTGESIGYVSAASPLSENLIPKNAQADPTTMSACPLGGNDEASKGTPRDGKLVWDLGSMLPFFLIFFLIF